VEEIVGRLTGHTDTDRTGGPVTHVTTARVTHGTPVQLTWHV
jgi:hypothetical protein